MSHWPLCVLLDFDGTIVNSEPLHFYALHGVLTEAEIEITESEYYRDLSAFNDHDAIRHAFHSRKLEVDSKTLLNLMARKSSVMMDLIEQRKYHALPGVEEFVRGLWRHYPLAICSGARREEIEAMLEGVSLRDCFGVIVAAEDVTVGKPDPQGYLKCMKLMEEKIKKPLHPRDCLIVEDAPSVIKSTKSAGFPTLGVATTHPLHELKDADWVVENLEVRNVNKVIPDLLLKP